MLCHHIVYFSVYAITDNFIHRNIKTPVASDEKKRKESQLIIGFAFCLFLRRALYFGCFCSLYLCDAFVGVIYTTINFTRNSVTD